MKYNITIILLLVSALFINSAYGQDVLTRVQNGEDVNVVYKDMALGGAFMHSEGWGLFFRKAKIVSIYKKWFWEVETATMHSDKEIKSQNTYFPDATSYYFGKLNGMQVFRFGTGYYRTVWRKNNERCVEIDAIYSGGLSLAVLKPVYLEIIEPTSVPDIISLSTQIYNPATDNIDNIYGRASVFDGLGQLTFHPGAYARLGLNFDYGNRHDMIKAVETGIEIDAYPQQIAIMAPQVAQNNQFFINYYLSISFGKRWF
ncbi:MAG: hypothetical protein ACLQQ4_03415 [Bacteroidia bacterium]